MTNSGTIIKGALLVAGTSIGGGMLALPVLTSASGFLPSVMIYILCWVFMMCTGLLFLEVCLWMNGESNIVSMAEKTLGVSGKIFAWGIYLFLFYCLSLAYIVGCGNMVASLFNGRLTDWQGMLLFVALFAPFVYAGARIVGKINFVLMIALIGSFLTFVVIGLPYVTPSLHAHQNWFLAFNAMPIAFTSFAYQGIIPTLVTYMHFNPKQIRFAIIIGTLIPFIAYVLWEWLILGIIPFHGPGGLQEALQLGHNAVTPLKEAIQKPWVYMIGQSFAFFALVTSFLGVTLGLVDFLADGLKIKKEAKNKFFLCLAVFIPPLILGFVYPHVFLSALDFAGGVGCALLLGLLPVVMVWVGRYRLNLISEYQLSGGKMTLILLGLFVLFELCFELSKVIG